MPDNGSYEDSPTGSVSRLGLNKKAKKKKGGVPGLLQSQLNNAQQEQPGALATMAENQGSLGTINSGSMNGADILLNKKKKKANGG